MEVYKLGKNVKSTTSGMVIITIQLIDSESGTDMSSFVTDPVLFKSCLQNDFYFPYKINMGKIVSIKSLDDAIAFPECELELTGKSESKLESGKYFKILNHDYTKTTDEGLHFLTVYKYKAAIINLTGSSYVPPNYTGSKVMYRFTGKLYKRFYFKNGVLVQEFEHYNNPFNSLKQTTKYNDQGIKETEYMYDSVENLIEQRIFRTDGTLFQRNTYTCTQLPSSSS